MSSKQQRIAKLEKEVIDLVRLNALSYEKDNHCFGSNSTWALSPTISIKI